MKYVQPVLIPDETCIRRDIEAFLVDREAGGCSARTIELYRYELVVFAAWLCNEKVYAVTDVTPDHLRRYMNAVGERRNPGGQHCSYRVIKTFLRWYEGEYEPQEWRNPITRIKPPKVAEIILPAVPPETIKRMLATCDRSFIGKRDKAIIMCLLDTGCRASEFCALDIEDISLDTGSVQVNRGKGGKQRVVFIGAKSKRELIRYLRERLGTEGPLWVTETGDRLQRRGLQALIKRRALLAEVQPPSLHSFRRAFALMCLQNGVDLISLQRLMGHSDLSIIRRYLALGVADLQRAHTKGSPVDSIL